MSPSLGADAVSGGIQFAVTAAQADSVTLCLFDGAREQRVAMQRQGDRHVVIASGAKPGQRYGFRANGPWFQEQGLLFDESKLLIDPYATALDGSFHYHPDLARFGADTAALMPKAVVTLPLAPLPLQPPLFVPGGLIYELNVKGFTINHPDVPPELRGTVAGLAHPAVIAHFQKLHVSAIELMPIIAWIDERHLPPLGLHNGWGYNPVVPMALEPALAPGGIGELRATVAALRQAGIGVILDLVLNHSGESEDGGPTLSLRGLDSRYYARDPGGKLINDTGTGNTLNAAEPMVRDLMLDTLRHFVRQCGVDGFRFDLAPVLARAPGFDPNAPIFAAIAQDPLLKDRILIAEPWDVGPGGYQLGNFPAGWLEWNDRYRDDVRRFWRGDARTAGCLATRMSGSSDIFAGEKSRSVNFLAAHDGFTLADLVTYQVKHNSNNGENNCDGQDENFSWNSGVEGPSHDPEVVARRGADVRALLATLFASKGTLLLTAGDEFGRTQLGNNNAYAQDNAITWVDWNNRDRTLEDFVAGLAASRASSPTVQDLSFLKQADWFGLDGTPMDSGAWNGDETAGFEVHIFGINGEAVAIRVDRGARQCTARRI